MKLENIPLGTTDWSQLPETVEAGEQGTANVRELQWGEIRVRFVTFSPDYVGNHWCFKGHIIFVLGGCLIIEHQGSSRYRVASGMSYHVSDNDGPPHRVFADGGATFFIID
jgi:hypothetical protein